MTPYTAEDAERVFSQGMSEVYAYIHRLDAEQRPAVHRAIAHLTGTTPPAEAGTEPDRGDDNDETDTELDPGAGTDSSGGES